MSLTKTEVYEQTAKLISASGVYSAELYSDYSGRGMYGETTPGIVTDAPGVFIGYCICTLEMEDEDDYSEFLPRKVDMLGRSTIYY